MVGKIATLGHKVLNHSVEGTSLVSVLLFIVTNAQRSKIFSSLWNIILEELTFEFDDVLADNLPRNEAHQSLLHFLIL